LPALLLRRGARVLAGRSLLLHKLLLFAFLLLLVLAVQLIIPTGKFPLRLESVLEDGFLGDQFFENLFLNKGRRVEGLFFLEDFNQALGKIRIKSVSPLARGFMDVSCPVTGVFQNLWTQTNHGSLGPRRGLM
jgi:hypothetical protein